MTPPPPLESCVGKILEPFCEIFLGAINPCVVKRYVQTPECSSGFSEQIGTLSLVSHLAESRVRGSVLNG